MLRKLLNQQAQWYVVIGVAIMAVFSVKIYGISILMYTLGICLAAVLLDGFIIFLRERRFIFPLSALVTGLIISAVLAPTTGFIIAPVIAILSKYIIRLSNRHIFNPAGFGLLAVNIFFGQQLNWGLANNVFLISGFGLLVLYQVRKLSLAAVFLLSIFIISFLSGVFIRQEAISNFYLTSLFFALFMLVEPKTSPLYLKGSLIYGISVAIFAGIGQLFLAKYDPLILSLAAGNIINIFLRKVG